MTHDEEILLKETTKRRNKNPQKDKDGAAMKMRGLTAARLLEW